MQRPRSHCQLLPSGASGSAIQGLSACHIIGQHGYRARHAAYDHCPPRLGDRSMQLGHGCGALRSYPDLPHEPSPVRSPASCTLARPILCDESPPRGCMDVVVHLLACPITRRRKSTTHGHEKSPSTSWHSRARDVIVYLGMSDNSATKVRSADA